MKKFLLALMVLTILLPVTVLATPTTQTVDLNQVNQKICSRFEEDVAKLAAIMEELRSRNGILETKVAFGGSDTPIKNADYWVTYTAEALAYQKAQKYSSKSSLRSNLETLRGKILRAKNEVRKALDEQK